MIVAIYSQKKDIETITYLKLFFNELKKKKIKPVIHHDLALSFKDTFETFSSKQDLLDKKVEMFFTFGGDGTLVSSILYIQDSEIPIVGVNTGRLGFLASFTKEQIFEEIDNLKNHKYTVSKRSLIEVVSPKIENFFPYALNDITISRRETTSMITIDSYINDEFLNVFWGDGLIISTPTGSTAYSLSCGGPIISPENDNFVITPIAPHNLNVRPLIVQDSVEFRLRVESRVPQFSLSLDSRIEHIDIETEIIIRKANFNIVLIQPTHLSFYETIRQKLLWGKDKRN